MVANIVDATSELLRRMGPEQITTNLIADATGISKGSIYQYFETKDHIIAAAIAASTASMIPRIRTQLARTALLPPGQMMDSSIEILIAFSTDNAATLRYLAEHPDLSQQVEAGSGLPILMQTMVTMHVQQYRDRYRADLEPESIAWLFINSAIATTLSYFEAGRPIDLEQLRTGLTLMARGLLADPR